MPSGVSLEGCKEYLHRVNPIAGGGGGGSGVTEVAHDDTLTGNGTNDSPLGVAETIKQEIADKLSSVSVDGTTITGDGTPGNPLVAAVQPQVNADWNATSGVAQILNKPNLATVATSGSYNDLSDKPTIPTVPVQDVEVNGSSVVDESGIAKVTVPTNTSDLNNNSGFITASQVPAQVNSDWNQTNSSAVDYIKNKPQNLALQAGENISIVESSGVITISSTGGESGTITDVKVNGTSVVDSQGVAEVVVPEQQQSSWTQNDTTAVDYIKGKPQGLALQAGTNNSIVERNGAITISSTGGGGGETITDVTVDG